MAKVLRLLRKRRILRKKDYAINVIFVSKERSRLLNVKYRKKNKPANILSFDYGNYGEIVICPEVVKKEAKKSGNSFKYQLSWMLVHGLLHLAEIHHEKSLAQAIKAERIEKEILQKIIF